MAAGTIHVFAVVGYDIATQSYFTYTYNIIDDEIKDFIDYSKTTSNFDDYENGVLPFEVPYEVNEYIDNILFASDGLVVDIDTGNVVEYNGEATHVYIPEYMPVDNGDGTVSVVKITGFEENVFKGNNNIEKVQFGKYVNGIPDRAFKGCESLKSVVCPSLESIGQEAFSGCYSLNEYTVSDSVDTLGTNAFLGVNSVKVNAANEAVAEAACYSGARRISVTNASDDTMLSNKKISISSNTDYFEFNGMNKTYTGLNFVSDAGTTVINGVTLNSSSGTPLKLSSDNVTLNRVTVNAPEFALILKSNATVSLYGNVNLNTDSTNAVLCKDIALQRANSSAVGKLNVSGNLMICGAISNESLLTVTNGEIIYIDEDSYNSLLNDSLDWVLESEVPEGATVLNQKWTYDMTSKVTSDKSSLEGYTLYDVTSTKEYGNWSAYSTTYAKKSDTLDVRTTTMYRYHHFLCPKCGYQDPATGSCSGCGYNIPSSAWRVLWLTTKGNTSTSAYYGGKYYIMNGGKRWYFEKDGQNNGEGFTGQPTCTGYSTRTITTKYTYYYTKTESLESFTEISESDTISNVQKWVQYVI